jgi:hypothetical protein
MIDEKYLVLFIGMLRYPAINQLETRDALLNVLYGTIPNGVPILCDTPTFCMRLISYTRQCDKEISYTLSQVTGLKIDNDSEFRALARLVSAALESYYGATEKTFNQ